jgi:phosphate transport system permease protein
MNERFRRRARRNDTIARWVITCGGILVIFSVVFILLLIVNVTLPLFQKPRAELYAKFAFPASAAPGEILAVGIDEYLESGFGIDQGGRFHFFETQRGTAIDQYQAPPPGGAGRMLLAVEDYGQLRFGLLWDDGSLTVEKIGFRPVFDQHNQNRRTLERSQTRLADFPPPSAGTAVRSLAQVDEAGRQTRVDLLADGRLTVTQRSSSENLLGEVTELSHHEELPVAAYGAITALALDSDGETLYAGTERGMLLRWSLADAGSAELLDDITAFTDRRAITALGVVFGDYSLAVGDAAGQVTAWFPVRSDPVSPRKSLRRIHELSRHAAAVTAVQPSPRDKSVLSLGSGGLLHLDHMTSERHLLTLGNQLPLARYAFSTRGNGVIGLTVDNRAVIWKLDNPHPETSWSTLFGKVWYEGYDEPAFVWQSSSGNDDFEPKMSLTPLIFGTLKGTFYAMLFAVPLALLGAIYTSQFCRPRLREIIKPTIEIMAAIPTVIIGFLAALWLAPIIERSLGAVFLSLIMLPACLILAVVGWQLVRDHSALKRVERGFEFLAIVPVLLLTVAAASVLGPLMEQWLFAGNLKLWLFQELNTRYDPRNCIIIAFGMGFAVIPLIFTIAEDSLSNVPPALKAASLACGASRWQTVWRVILPSASPGIFAGIMIGFGRAVGETMIVLMATGNTPIIDLSPFNGMRPLSANIAVEIPEAPHGGTLYRVLFLSAVILFMMTFVVNTAAELVRQRLRKKYGRF